MAQLEKPSLTFLLVNMHPPTKNVKEAEEEFELISSDEVAYPVAAIHDEVKRRVGKGPAAAGPQHFTMIQIDRITDITCQANGDVAKGTVSYEVPPALSRQVRLRGQAERRPLAHHRDFHVRPQDSLDLRRDGTMARQVTARGGHARAVAGGGGGGLD